MGCRSTRISAMWWVFFPNDLLRCILDISEGNWIGQEKQECGWAKDGDYFDPIGKLRNTNYSTNWAHLEKVAWPSLLPVRQLWVKTH